MVARGRLDGNAARRSQWVMDDDLLFLSAQQAGRHIRDGELRVADYATAVLDALEASQATLNACVTINRMETHSAADFDATAEVTVNGKPCGITRQSWTACRCPRACRSSHRGTAIPSFSPWAASWNCAAPWTDKRPTRETRSLA